MTTQKELGLAPFRQETLLGRLNTELVPFLRQVERDVRGGYAVTSISSKDQTLAAGASVNVDIAITRGQIDCIFGLAIADDGTNSFLEYRRTVWVNRLGTLSLIDDTAEWNVTDLGSVTWTAAVSSENARFTLTNSTAGSIAYSLFFYRSTRALPGA